MPLALSRQKTARFSPKTCSEDTAMSNARPIRAMRRLLGMSMVSGPSLPLCIRPMPRPQSTTSATSTSLRLLSRMNCARRRCSNMQHWRHSPGLGCAKELDFSKPSASSLRTSSLTRILFSCCPSALPSFARVTPRKAWTKFTMSCFVAKSLPVEIFLSISATASGCGSFSPQVCNKSRSSWPSMEPEASRSILSHSSSMALTSTAESSSAVKLRRAWSRRMESLFFPQSSKSIAGLKSAIRSLGTTPDSTSISQSAGFSESGISKPRPVK
mmetsp:Transcript_105333/g.250764  ORF Transcript_105333/g.250764 Transcript_105333/m.250764 type:complete len:271 (-) Transcript_105333:1338-2150(-)